VNILITGGTGSFGQAVTERLLSFNRYQKIGIYSRDEHKQELMAKRLNNPKLRFFIGDIRDKERLALAIQDYEIIIHTAALKIVPSAEYNPFEYIKTNIMGAQNLVDVCINSVPYYGTRALQKVIVLSTDKAVHPINLYGATKLCAEKIFKAANNIRGPNGPKFSIVRYGNVANSNGSVIPLYMQQLKENKQLTITDDSMTRFWITLDDAVNFVLQCIDRMYGGETFVPDMPSFNIKDLALVMMGNYPLERQWTEIIGVRPGEKLHEEIITKEEFQNSIYDKETNTWIINPSAYVKHSSDWVIDFKREALTSNSTFVNKMNATGIKEELTKLGVM